MRRVKVVFRPDALDDLANIYFLISASSCSRSIASKFVARVMARCRKIGDVPYGGRQRDDLMAGLRTIAFAGRAVIAYRVDDTVEIVNVFYGGRDYEAIYREKLQP